MVSIVPYSEFLGSSACYIDKYKRSHGKFAMGSTLASDGRSTRSVSSLPEVAGGRTGGKGLRHFSMKVCEKVESKGRTTYNEVADELVKDFSSPEMTGAPLSGIQAHFPGSTLRDI